MALLLVLVALAGAEGVTRRLALTPGRQTVTVSGSVLAPDQDTYLVGARSGQQLLVALKGATLEIVAPTGAPLPGAGPADQADGFLGRLPRTGDYQLRIIPGDERCNYSLTVTVH